MAYVRLTVLRPTAGHTEQALETLRELDGFLAEESGLIMSLVFHEEAVVGRISVWETEAESNVAAQKDLSLALRSRLVRIPGDHIIELLARADTGTWSPGALRLLAGTLGWKEPNR